MHMNAKGITKVKKNIYFLILCTRSRHFIIIYKFILVLNSKNSFVILIDNLLKYKCECIYCIPLYMLPI